MSKLRIYSLLILCACSILSACSIGAPPGFSAGTEWAFPLVDPLDNGLLVTPVRINGKGPYLFVIDPEATSTVIDERIAHDAELRVDHGYAIRLRGDDGQLRPRRLAELLNLQVGSLTVERRFALVVPHDSLAVLGRDIRGVIGRNIIADSLVFGFDRDRGIAWLQEVPHFQPRPDAVALPIDVVRSADDNGFGADSLRPAGRGAGVAAAGSSGDNRAPEIRAKAMVGDKQLTMNVVFSSIATRLRAATRAAFGLGNPTETVVEVDATGAPRGVPVSAGALPIALGAARNDHALIGDYVNADEMASSDRFLDGTIGVDFFTPYAVVADWDARKLYVSPRGDTAAQTQLRLSRWGDLARCPHAGCVSVSLVAPPGDAAPTQPGFASGSDTPPAAAPPAGPAELHVVRDPGATMPLEIRLRAAGHRDLLVELPAGMPELVAPVQGDVGDVHYDVIDVNPFPAGCPGGAPACVR